MTCHASNLKSITENGARGAREITEYFNETRCMKGLPLITHPLQSSFIHSFIHSCHNWTAGKFCFLKSNEQIVWKMWEPHLTTLWASTDCYMNTFILPFKLLTILLFADDQVILTASETVSKNCYTNYLMLPQSVIWLFLFQRQKS
jgi:hypothetical protein